MTHQLIARLLTSHMPRRAAPALTILLFALALTYRMVLLDQSLYWGDISLYFAPILQFERSALLQGKLPLWNPYVFCGQPLVGNPQVWLFYPGTVLLTVLPVPVYLGINAWAHVVLAGAGMYLYLRRICGDRIAATLGAVTFCGSGFLAARMQFPAMVQCATLLPFLVLLVDRVIMRPGYRDLGLLSLLVALTLLAGHPQVAHMSLLVAAAYAGACLWRVRQHPLRLRAGMRVLAIGLGLGILAAGAQLLPGAQLYAQSTRADLTLGSANRFVLLPEQLITLVLPYWFGSPERGNYWGAGNIWEPCVYVGILPLAMALYAISRGSRRHAVRFFIILCLAALWLAMGRDAGLYWLAFYLIPGQSAWHDPARFVFLFTFALAVLAAVGMRLLRDRHVRAGWRVAVVGIALVDLWWFSGGFNPTVPRRAYEYRPRALQVVRDAGPGRTYSTLREAVWRRYVNYADYGPSSTRYANELTYTLSPNIGMRFGVREASGYEPVPTDHIGKVDGLVRASLERQSPHLEDLLLLTNAHTLLLPQSTRHPHPALRPHESRGVAAFAVRDPYPRAWIVRRTVRIDDDQRSLAALAAPDFDTSRLATVCRSRGIDQLSAGPDPGFVQLVHTEAGSVQMLADAGRTRGLLVLSATYYPGWKATVDGLPVRLERVDHAMMGVFLQPGRHTVRFAYEPFVVRFALYLSLLGVMGLVAALAYGGLLRTRLRSDRQTPAGERAPHAELTRAAATQDISEIRV